MGETATRRSQLGLVAWITALTVGLWAFHQLGSGWLEPPPARPGGWGAWAEGRDPLVATVAVLRLIVLALGWYLLLVTSLGIVVRLVRAPRMARFADRITVPALRRLLLDALGATLATAVLATGPAAVGPTARADAAPPEVTDVLPGLGHGRDGPDADGSSDRDDGRAQGGAISLDHEDRPHRQDAAAPTLPGTSLPLPLDIAGGHHAPGDDATNGGSGSSAGTEGREDATRSDVSATPRPLGGGAPAPSLAGGDADAGGGADAVGTDAVPAGDVTVSGEQAVIVQPGDSLWSIARDALAASRSQEPRSQAPDDATVSAYWTVLVEHNRPHLPDPDNPDLIFPGDTVLLPPLPLGASSR